MPERLAPLGVGKRQQLQRAVALERPKRVPDAGAVEFCDGDLFRERLADLRGHVQGSGDALDPFLGAAVGKHDPDGHRGLARGLDGALLARVELLKQLDAARVELGVGGGRGLVGVQGEGREAVRGAVDRRGGHDWWRVRGCDRSIRGDLCFVVVLFACRARSGV